MTIERREYYIEDPAIPRLFIQSWMPVKGDKKGTILITHGISEHSESYHFLAQDLAEKGWNIFAWDLEGHGKSPGKRGYIKEFTDFRRDLGFVINEIKKDQDIKSTPFILLGHSMGGLITLSFMLQDKLPAIDAVVLSSPCLGIAIEVPKYKDVLSHWLNNIWPSFTLENEVILERLSRDPSMLQKYKSDPLRHHKISAPLYLGMLEEMKYVRENIGRLKRPIFMQVAGTDHIVDPKASLELFKNIHCEKKIHIYDESFHEVYNDTNRKEVIDHLLAYLGEYES